MKVYLAGVPGGGWFKRERIVAALEKPSLVLFLYNTRKKDNENK